MVVLLLVVVKAMMMPNDPMHPPRRQAVSANTRGRRMRFAR